MTFEGFGGGGSPLGDEAPGLHEVQFDHRLLRIMAFCGYDQIEDLEHPVAEQRIRFFIAVDEELSRRGEVLELEKQWNPLGRDG